MSRTRDRPAEIDTIRANPPRTLNRRGGPGLALLGALVGVDGFNRIAKSVGTGLALRGGPVGYDFGASAPFGSSTFFAAGSAAFFFGAGLVLVSGLSAGTNFRETLFMQ